MASGLFVAAILVPMISATVHAWIGRWLISLLALAIVTITLLLLLLLIIVVPLLSLITAPITTSRHTTYFHGYNPATSVVVITMRVIIPTVIIISRAITGVICLPIIHSKRHSLRIVYCYRIT